MSQVLVLGANGFIGTHVVTALLAAGHVVRVYERRLPMTLPVGVGVFQGLLEDRAALSVAMRGVDAVLYLSWTGYPATFEARFALDIHANIFTAIGVMETCCDLGVKKLIFASSGGTVYGVPRTLPIRETHSTEPISEHGLGKLIAERYLAVYRHRGEIRSLVIRCANAYGPGQRPDRGQGFVGTVLGRLATGKAVEVWGDGSVVRDYVYVEDVARAFAAAVGYEGDEAIFNVGSGRGVSVREMITAVEAATGQAPTVDYKPGRRNDVPANVLDVSLIERELGWRPTTPLGIGLRETWEWIRTTWSPGQAARY